MEYSIWTMKSSCTVRVQSVLCPVQLLSASCQHQRTHQMLCRGPLRTECSVDEVSAAVRQDSLHRWQVASPHLYRYIVQLHDITYTYAHLFNKKRSENFDKKVHYPHEKIFKPEFEPRSLKCKANKQMPYWLGRGLKLHPIRFSKGWVRILYCVILQQVKLLKLQTFGRWHCSNISTIANQPAIQRL